MVRRLMGQMKKNEGFTLIELLVVVAIIALLATFAVPKLFEAINKSKAAPGQADMNTISSGLERYYMDNSTFPIGATAAAISSELSGGYLKANTSYLNGWKHGYIYVSDSAGSYYVLIDAGNTPSTTSLTLSCGTTAVTQAVTTGASGLSVVQSSTITAAKVAEGCSITTAGVTAHVVTN